MDYQILLINSNSSDKLNYSFEAPDILKSELIGKPVTEYFEEGELLIGDYYKKNYLSIFQELLLIEWAVM